MPPGPRSSAEAAASRILVADVRATIVERMKKGDVSRAELARRMSVTPARISSILGKDGNLTLETAARVFYALGVKHITITLVDKENGNGNADGK